MPVVHSNAPGKTGETPVLRWGARRLGIPPDLLGPKQKTAPRPFGIQCAVIDCTSITFRLT